MKKTLIVSFPYASAMGGGERYLERLVAGMPERSFTLVSSSRALLSLFRARGWKAFPFWAGIEPVSMLSVILFPIFALIFLPFFVVLLSVAKRRGCDSVICLSLTDKLLATGPAKLLGLRVIWLEHLVPGRSVSMNPYRFFLARLTRWAEIVTVSEAVKAALVDIGYAEHRIRVIPPGLSPDELNGTAAAASKSIGVVSRLAPEKNLPFLFKAFASTVKQVPEATLVVRGVGPEEAYLRHLADELGIAASIRWAGFSSDRSGLYADLRVLAVPSSRESFGLSALEAMGRGVPVVATRVGGLPEAVVDGETGFLVPLDDALAFSGALVTLLSDDALHAAYAEAAHRRAADVFPLERTIDAWKRLLSDTSSDD